MVEPTASQIQLNAGKPGNTRQKVEAERKGSTELSVPAANTAPPDRIELALSQADSSDLRPEQDPIDSEEQAGEIILFTGQNILSDASIAAFAQANLNPDRVLELIA